jgi:low affinity Fe/Cu permease
MARDDRFHRFAVAIAGAMGRSAVFFGAVMVIIVWAVTGPLFHFSDTWQLVINTGTTIVTFLMVFLIQNTQNRDGRALHLKLDELIRAVHGARNKLVALEDFSDDELRTLHDEFHRLHERARQRTRDERDDDGGERHRR